MESFCCGTAARFRFFGLILLAVKHLFTPASWFAILLQTHKASMDLQQSR